MSRRPAAKEAESAIRRSFEQIEHVNGSRASREWELCMQGGLANPNPTLTHPSIHPLANPNPNPNLLRHLLKHLHDSGRQGSRSKLWDRALCSGDNGVFR